MPVTAVVFDLDYTLAVPERDRQTLLDETAKAVGVPRVSRESYLDAHRRNLTSETREPIFAELLDDEASANAAAETYRNAIGDALVPIEGAESMITDLERTYRVGLLTDGPVCAQQAKLDALGWNDLFDSVVITGSLVAGKPDERAFRAIIEALSADADETVYVGDRPEIDVAGARDAGLRAIHVIDNGETAPEADATVERDALAVDLPGLLDALG